MHANHLANHQVRPLLSGSGDALRAQGASAAQIAPQFQVKRCYCGVTEGEFVVLSREQLRTGSLEISSGGNSHLVSSTEQALGF